MPNSKEHCKQSEDRYRFDFKLIHDWMDEPCHTHGPSHRKERHDLINTPFEALEIFLNNKLIPEKFRKVSLIRRVVQDHIHLDNKNMRYKKENKQNNFKDNKLDKGEIIDYYSNTRRIYRKLFDYLNSNIFKGQSPSLVLSNRKMKQQGVEYLKKWYPKTKEKTLMIHYRGYVSTYEKFYFHSTLKDI